MKGIFTFKKETLLFQKEYSLKLGIHQLTHVIHRIKCDVKVIKEQFSFLKGKWIPKKRPNVVFATSNISIS